MNQSKSVGRRLIEKVFNSRRINDSAIYRLYLRLWHRKHYRATQVENAFYCKLIRQAGGGTVFDVGANGGDKAVIFKKAVDLVVCVEPSPAAVKILKERFANSPQVSIVANGVGAERGSYPFHMFGESDCYNTFSQKWAESLGESGSAATREIKNVQKIVDVPVTTLDLLIEKFGLPCYIKIDVEGYELEVIKGLTKSVNLISIECNLPEFEAETLESISRIEGIRPNSQFNYSITEPPEKFASEQCLSASEMKEIVRTGGHTFMEIFAKSP